MSVIRKTQTVTAGATTANLVAGSVFEFLTRPSAVRVFAAQDTATGAVEMTFKLGNVVFGEDLPLPVKTAGLGPDQDQDKLVGAMGAPGDRISVILKETGGVTNTPTRVQIEINEVA